MICPQCRHENPAGNRFCGSYGTKLPVADVRVDTKTPTLTWLKSMEENKPAGPTPRELELQRIEAEHAAREREVAERAERAARREREIAERARAKAALVQPQHQASARNVSGGAPSFLGLSGGYEPEQTEETTTEEYDRSDIYGGGRSYTRAFLLLVLLLVVAGLGFLQWRYSSGLRASPPVEKPSAAQAEGAPTEDQPAAPDGSEAKPEDAQAGKSESKAGSPAEKTKPNTDESAVDEEASNSADTKTQAEEPRTGKMQPPSEPEPQAKAANGTEPQRSTKDTAANKATNDQAEAKSKPTARVRTQRELPAEVSDEPVRRAESYIYGRGLPQSCPQGVSILREAANRGNYKAQIKLGALYATGNCVSLDRVQAYRFLTRALQGKPGNTWVEQNRSMLWAQMNEQERREAMQQNF
jgi:hypothetical protein